MTPLGGGYKDELVKWLRESLSGLLFAGSSAGLVHRTTASYSINLDGCAVTLFCDARNPERQILELTIDDKQWQFGPFTKSDLVKDAAAEILRRVVSA